MFVLCFIGIGISFFPFIVPTSVTIWQAAAPDNSLAFLLVGALVLLPLIIGYTAYAYWVFRGKVSRAKGILMRESLRKAMWFVALWLAGVATVAAVGLLIRLVLT